MRIAILSIGDELLLGQSVDTNSAWISEQLVRHSCIAVEHRTVGDDRAAIAEALVELTSHCGAVIATGGLGPTDDDLTREALGDVVTPGEPLVRNDDAVESIARWFRGRSRPMPEANLRQAALPRTAETMSNRLGTAPGVRCVHKGCRIFLLPGPPHEMKRMFEHEVLPHLIRTHSGDQVLTEIVQLYGLGESDAAQLLGDLMHRARNPRVGITASDGIITARLVAQGKASVIRELLASDVDRISGLWSPFAFGVGETSLSQALGNELRARGRTICTAESCTGGWLGKTIVDVPGSSEYYLGGWVTYSDDLKRRCLGVPAELLAHHGAVSGEVARAMAQGALEESGSDHAISITGVAGPGDENSRKPAGLVYIALADRSGGEHVASVHRFRFRGDRTAVRDRSVKSALQLLRFRLLGASEPLIWEQSGEPEEARAHDG